MGLPTYERVHTGRQEQEQEQKRGVRRAETDRTVCRAVFSR